MGKTYNRSKRLSNRWSLPPEGLWISPAGKMESVNEHLLALAERPDIFGLTQQDVAGADEKSLLALGERLIVAGWTRYRYLDGKYLFEVDNAKNRAGIIERVLQKAQAISQEEVVITQFSPHQEFSGTVGALYDGSIFRFANKKAVCKWAFSYDRRGS